ncbi:hypothetical protein CoNPh27_CDS0069 [Staphylococcus phage S-CoN_Ph27]|nr:hypothetical protein CoNPh27_CDS0069 [Staphylococcus phage S-CoN_Ph27]
MLKNPKGVVILEAKGNDTPKQPRKVEVETGSDSVTISTE